MPRKGVKMSADLVEMEIDVIEIPSWARSLPRDYLEESVQERGVIQPVLIAAIPTEDKRKNRYILVDGHGRLTLAKKKGLKTIPARIVKLNNEEEALLLAIELEQTRAPWSLEYTLNVIQELVNRGYSKSKIAEVLKVPRSKVYRLLWILEFPEELKQMFVEGQLPLRAADAIVSLVNKIKEIGVEDPYDTIWFRNITLRLKEEPQDYENIIKGWIEMLEQEEEEEEGGEGQEEGQEEEEEEEEAEEEGQEEEEEEEEEKLLTVQQVEERLSKAVPTTPEEEEEAQEEEGEEEEEEAPEELHIRTEGELKRLLKQYNAFGIRDIDATAEEVIIYAMLQKGDDEKDVTLYLSKKLAAGLIASGIQRLIMFS